MIKKMLMILMLVLVGGTCTRDVAGPETTKVIVCTTHHNHGSHSNNNHSHNDKANDNHDHETDENAVVEFVECEVLEDGELPIHHFDSLGA